MPKSSTAQPLARGIPVEPLVVGASEIAIMTNSGESTIWARFASGEIKSFKIGGKRVARVEEVKRYIAAAEAKGL